jgi:mRNA-degrading endonuclease toxin of MazEF toxin-antitoxin module
MTTRGPGDVYWYAYPPEIGTHMTVVVSRPTSRSHVIAAFITTQPQPDAPDVIPLGKGGLVRGYVRCDMLMTVEHNDPFWKKYVARLDDSILEKVREGVRAAVGL